VPRARSDTTSRSPWASSPETRCASSRLPQAYQAPPAWTKSSATAVSCAAARSRSPSRASSADCSWRANSAGQGSALGGGADQRRELAHDTLSAPELGEQREPTSFAQLHLDTATVILEQPNGPASVLDHHVAIDAKTGALGDRERPACQQHGIRGGLAQCARSGEQGLGAGTLRRDQRVNQGVEEERGATTRSGRDTT